jgi:uncharacterized protein (DUF427 family)
MGLFDTIRRTVKGDDGGQGGAIRATWNGVTLAESDQTVIVEGNHYFPPDSVARGLLRESATHTTCPWKGLASYYNVVLEDGAINPDAAWYYPEPSAAASEIKDYVAFWHGVRVAPVPEAAPAG